MGKELITNTWAYDENMLLIQVLWWFCTTLGMFCYEVLSEAGTNAQYIVMFPDEAPQHGFFIPDMDFFHINRYLQGIMNAANYWMVDGRLEALSPHSLECLAATVNEIHNGFTWMRLDINRVLELDDPMVNISDLYFHQARRHISEVYLDVVELRNKIELMRASRN